MEDQAPATLPDPFAGDATVAVGIPLYRALPVQPAELPEGPLDFDWAMREVEANEYHCLVGVAQAGLSESFDERQLCVFSCDLKSGAREAGNSAQAPARLGENEVGNSAQAPARQDGQNLFPQSLRMRNANLVHYAVSLGSFRAAAALLVICPAFLQMRCTVTIVWSRVSTTEAQWSSSDLVRLFATLYSVEHSPQDASEQANVQLARDQYTVLLPVLEQGEANLASLPFLALPTVNERIAAAGFEPDRVVQAFVLSAQCSRQAQPSALNGELSIVRES